MFTALICGEAQRHPTHETAMARKSLYYPYCEHMLDENPTLYAEARVFWFFGWYSYLKRTYYGYPICPVGCTKGSGC